ncbi:MAG: transglutaminase domain-containing protein [Phycisphaerales bacterium]|nr:MAG: transglutaminase domain-containing protein [Phycisphaerales bacterium]
MNIDMKAIHVLLRWSLVATAGALFTLSLVAPSRTYAEGRGRLAVVPVENPRYCDNELFRAFENYYSPRIRKLRTRYGLDAVVANETDEWKRILLLRHWIKSNIAIDNDKPTQTRGDTFGILDAALKGGKFHCTHFSIVQHAILNSFGYVTRRLGCGPGLKNDGGHHGVNEVWVNKFGKWVLIDAKYDAHFEKDGVALSALEIRDEVWRDGAKSVVCVVGPKRKPMRPNSETGKLETRPDTYRWCSWETNTNRFTTFPARPTSTLVMLDDEMFRKHTWYRDARPHWAYDTPYLIKTTRRDWIEWTPNVITSKVTIRDRKAHVFLSSCTPNFRSFQIKGNDGTWCDCSEEVELPFDSRARKRFAFRTINLFGVAGPEHHVQIVYQPHRK